MVLTLWMACHHRLVDADEPQACARARAAPTAEAWAAAFWADPEAGCHAEAVEALRRAAPAEPPADDEGSSRVMTDRGRVPRAVETLLASVSPVPPRVWISDPALEPVRAAVELCVADADKVAGRARLLGAIGPSGVVRVGAIDGDPAITRCVTGLEELELPPSAAPRPLDVTLVVEKG